MLCLKENMNGLCLSDQCVNNCLRMKEFLRLVVVQTDTNTSVEFRFDFYSRSDEIGCNLSLSISSKCRMSYLSFLIHYLKFCIFH